VTRAPLLLAALALAATGAPPAAAAMPSPTRFAAKAAAKAKRSAPRCTKRARLCPRGWRATPIALAVTPPLPRPAPLDAPAPEPVPSAPHDEDAPVQPANTPPPPAAPLCDPSPWLGVTAEDVAGVFRLRLTRKCVPAGTVLFQFRNVDLAEHNLWAEGVEPAAPDRQIVPGTPGETTVTASADLSAGQWRLYCALPGHETMSRLVDVTPAG
jgi:hypothetical protein